MERFCSIGVIKNEPRFDSAKLDAFLARVAGLRARRNWDKQDLAHLFHDMIPDFGHKETGKYLDGRM